MSVHLLGGIDLDRVPIGRIDDAYCAPLKPELVKRWLEIHAAAAQ